MKRTPEQTAARNKWMATLMPDVLSRLACISFSQAVRLIRRAKDANSHLVEDIFSEGKLQ